MGDGDNQVVMGGQRVSEGQLDFIVIREKGQRHKRMGLNQEMGIDKR